MSSREPEPNRAALCPHCMTVLEPAEHVCPSCGRPAASPHSAYLTDLLPMNWSPGGAEGEGTPSIPRMILVWTVAMLLIGSIVDGLFPGSGVYIVLGYMFVLPWRILRHHARINRETAWVEEELPPEEETDLLTAEALSYGLEEEPDEESAGDSERDGIS